MTHIIQLMTVITLILPTVFRSPRMQRITNRTVSIQITVRLLSFPYQVNQAIHISIQFGIFLHSQQISRSFHNLIHIRIVKRIRRIKTSLFQFPGNSKIIYTAGFLTFVKSKRHSYISYGLDTSRPKFISKMYIGKRHILISIIFQTLYSTVFQ